MLERRPARFLTPGEAQRLQDAAEKDKDPEAGPFVTLALATGARRIVQPLDALRRIGLQPASTVYVQSVVEEESTGNGALMTHLRGYKADAVLIPEPEDEKLVRANVGVVWFQV